ncbi:CLUMA_CG002427, isoform A [Clunio marinus]|uniref:CLUMA_CG002427, isoform A n=1 Tax=Clunio marinus TaxID=568069 RepID=A0A1J1HQD8_9DIPT|nr:CLUMA_CG002427, isoform A [Clunio marinus]
MENITINCVGICDEPKTCNHYEALEEVRQAGEPTNIHRKISNHKSFSFMLIRTLTSIQVQTLNSDEADETFLD